MLVVLDIHGVLADFVGAFRVYHEIHPSVLWPKGVYDIEIALGANGVKVGTVEDLPIKFWSNLPMTHEARDILSLLLNHNIPVMISTKLSSDANAIGTYLWYLKNVSQFPFMPISLDYKGELLSSDRMLLIDDSDSEIANWQGPSILLPRPWNSGRGLPMVAVVNGLRKAGVL